MLTELNLREGMRIIDIFGTDHDLTKLHVRVILIVGWACFLGSWIINLGYYKFHPSSVASDFKKKNEIFILGQKTKVPWQKVTEDGEKDPEANKFEMTDGSLQEEGAKENIADKMKDMSSLQVPESKLTENGDKPSHCPPAV